MINLLLPSQWELGLQTRTGRVLDIGNLKKKKKGRFSRDVLIFLPLSNAGNVVKIMSMLKCSYIHD